MSPVLYTLTGLALVFLASRWIGGEGLAWFTPRQSAAPAPDPVERSFYERCTHPAVVFCDPLDVAGPWGVDASGVRRLMPNPDGSEGLPKEHWWQQWRGRHPDADNGKGAELDTEVKASGAGSVRFRYGKGDANHAGDFMTNFSDDGSQTFNDGDTFYVQYRYRLSCEMLYLDCDEASPGYKKERRRPVRGNGANTFFKQSIVNSADVPGHFSGSCDGNEIVLQHYFEHSLRGYHGCGWSNNFSGIESSGLVFGSPQFDFQPGGDHADWYYPNPRVRRKHGWGYVGPRTWTFEPDEWMTIQQKVTLGPSGERKNQRGKSHITIWAAHEGEPQRVVVDIDFPRLGEKHPSTGEWLPYGKIWLLPYTTAKDPTLEQPEASIWYDELIVSTELIADPE